MPRNRLERRIAANELKTIYNILIEKKNEIAYKILLLNSYTPGLIRNGIFYDKSSQYQAENG